MHVKLQASEDPKFLALIPASTFLVFDAKQRSQILGGQLSEMGSNKLQERTWSKPKKGYWWDDARCSLVVLVEGVKVLSSFEVGFRGKVACPWKAGDLTNTSESGL